MIGIDPKGLVEIRSCLIMASCFFMGQATMCEQVCISTVERDGGIKQFNGTIESSCFQFNQTKVMEQLIIDPALHGHDAVGALVSILPVKDGCCFIALHAEQSPEITPSQVKSVQFVGHQSMVEAVFWVVRVEFHGNAEVGEGSCRVTASVLYGGSQEITFRSAREFSDEYVRLCSG